jgi:DNA (cytosine-5)-methyltransferase 1
LCEPFIIGKHKNDVPRSCEDPLPAITTRGPCALVQPFLTKYYGTGGAVSVNEPLDTVTVNDRFALVEPVKDGMRMEILFRMLQPHELAAAMGFEGYAFTGNKTEQVKQIGNAVPVNTAQALCGNILRRIA